MDFTTEWIMGSKQDNIEGNCYTVVVRLYIVYFVKLTLLCHFELLMVKKLHNSERRGCMPLVILRLYRSHFYPHLTAILLFVHVLYACYF